MRRSSWQWKKGADMGRKKYGVNSTDIHGRMILTMREMESIIQDLRRENRKIVDINRELYDENMGLRKETMRLR